MTAPQDKIIDGFAYAAGLREKLGHIVQKLIETTDKVPHLCVIIVGEDPASQVYVRNKSEQAQKIGMRSTTLRFDATISETELLDRLTALNSDADVHGILVQLPLPNHISALRVIETIDPKKDVDGFHTHNAGCLSVGLDGLVPCTPLGSLMLLKDRMKRFDDHLSGKHAVIIGRSNIVGKPMAQLLLSQDCTVTTAHSKTKNLAELCRQADIIVACVGRPRFVQGDWVKPGATIIDVGINRISENETSKLVGDVDFDQAILNARAITPVPKGVGPMTIACLLHNTLKAFCRQNDLPFSDLV